MTVANTIELHAFIFNYTPDERARLRDIYRATLLQQARPGDRLCPMCHTPRPAADFDWLKPNRFVKRYWLTRLTCRTRSGARCWLTCARCEQTWAGSRTSRRCPARMWQQRRICGRWPG